VLQVYRTIASSAAVKQKVNLLAYFESLCSDTSAANVLINSSLTVLFVRMLRNGKLPLLRIRLASVLGLLIRHATFIADELAGTNLVQILSEALSDINERVRRRYGRGPYMMHDRMYSHAAWMLLSSGMHATSIVCSSNVSRTHAGQVQQGAWMEPLTPPSLFSAARAYSRLHLAAEVSLHSIRLTGSGQVYGGHASPEPCRSRPLVCHAAHISIWGHGSWTGAMR
jgi:hypothetical protein